MKKVFCFLSLFFSLHLLAQIPTGYGNTTSPIAFVNTDIAQCYAQACIIAGVTTIPGNPNTICTGYAPFFSTDIQQLYCAISLIPGGGGGGGLNGKGTAGIVAKWCKANELNNSDIKDTGDAQTMYSLQFGDTTVNWGSGYLYDSLGNNHVSIAWNKHDLAPFNQANGVLYYGEGQNPVSSSSIIPLDYAQAHYRGQSSNTQIDSVTNLVGPTITSSGNNPMLMIRASGPIANPTIVFPSSPLPFQNFFINTEVTINGITYTSNNINQQPLSISAGETIGWIYNDKINGGTGGWQKIENTVEYGGPLVTAPDGNYLITASGVTAGSYTNTNLTVNSYGLITAASNGSAGSPGWNLTGNSGTTVGTDFLGTTDSVGLMAKANGIQHLYFDINTNSSYIGERSGENATGTNNNSQGDFSLYHLTTGNYNDAMGYDAGYNITTGEGNAALSNGALYTATAASGNVAIGHYAGHLATSDFGVYIGDSAGEKTSTAPKDVFIGYASGFSNTVGAANVIIGPYACYNLAQSKITALGDSAGIAQTSGQFNIYIGHDAGPSNSSGSNGIFIGDNAGGGANTGSNNICIGRNTNNSASSGDHDNLYMGTGAGGSGSEGTVIGQNSACSGCSGSNMTVLGYGAGGGNAYNDFFCIGSNSSPLGSNTGELGDNSLLYTASYGTYVGQSSAPSLSAGTGAGSGPTVSDTGSNLSGTLVITTGTTPTGSNAIIVTATFANSLSFPNGSSVLISPANANAAGLATSLLQVYINSSKKQFILYSGTTGLPSFTTFVWKYITTGY